MTCLIQSMPESRSSYNPRKRRSSSVATENGSTATPKFVVALISADDSLQELASEACQSKYELVVCTDPTLDREALFRPNVKLIIVDDEAVDEGIRGWLLDQIRRFSHQSMLVYVASHYSESSEKRARSYQVQYYTSKPVDPDRTLRVLRSLLEALKARETV